MRPSRRQQFLVASGLGVLFAGGAIAPAAAAPVPASEPSAQSQAVLARLVPYVGLPGVTTSVGLVTAQVASGVARSSAAAADFGLLGTDVAPPPTATDTSSEIVATAPQSLTPAAFRAPEDSKRTAAAVGLGIILVVIVALAVGDRIRIAAAAAK